LEPYSTVKRRTILKMKSKIHLFLLTVMAVSIVVFTPLSYASQDDPYESGYNHGCEDAGISDPSERYINQPGKGPSFHTGSFMNGYYDGFNACSDGVGDDNNAENNAVDGNLRVIATLDMGTYGNQYCDDRTFDMWVYVRSELAQERIIGACDGQETTFSGLDVGSSSSFRICAYGNELDLSGCRTGVNGPESEPERLTISIS
jgi:hypothetical protein